MNNDPPLSITGTGCLSRLGCGLVAHREALARPPADFRRLSELGDFPVGFEDRPAGWIEPRSLLSHRQWSPSSMAAIEVSRQALAASGWTAADRRDAVVFLGTSRGSLAGWLDPWPGRRPFPLMAASNSLPAEPAAAVAREFGIEGPWQTISNGCCAGLDALGMASLWLRAGLARRALVVAVDLPLVRPIMEAYAATGILAGPTGHGMIPAEGAAAICLDSVGSTTHPRLMSYTTLSETTNPLGGGADHSGLSRLLETAGIPSLAIPHASGTAAQRDSEPSALRQAFGENIPSLPLKPWTGHTIGASGLIETVLACSFLTDGIPCTGIPPLAADAVILKLASALGGKHSLVTLQLPS